MEPFFQYSPLSKELYDNQKANNNGSLLFHVWKKESSWVRMSIGNMHRRKMPKRVRNFYKRVLTVKMNQQNLAQIYWVPMCIWIPRIVKCMNTSIS